MFVLDASALLCLIFREPGAERVETLIDDARISAVNYGEVVTKLVERGQYDGGAKADLAALGRRLMPLDREMAELAGVLRAETRRAGLSLADRCCLALAMRLGATAVTTDRAWANSPRASASN